MKSRAGQSRSQGHVSVSRPMYDVIKREAAKRGIPMSVLVEAATHDVAALSEAEQVSVLEPVPEPAPPPPPEVRTFLCAVCVREATCVPTREPFGRGGALVDVCVSCSEEDPRARDSRIAQSRQPRC